MQYGFETDDENAAVAALIVYAVYRSRDKGKFKVTPQMWGQIERFVKASAKRARTVPEFLDALKPRLECAAIQPQWIAVGAKGEIPTEPVYEGGKLKHVIQRSQDPDAREFGVQVIENADGREVLARLYKETAWVVLLVRDRLEREKPIESQVNLDEVEDQ